MIGEKFQSGIWDENDYMDFLYEIPELDSSFNINFMECGDIHLLTLEEEYNPIFEEEIFYAFAEKKNFDGYDFLKLFTQLFEVYNNAITAKEEKETEELY